MKRNFYYIILIIVALFYFLVKYNYYNIKLSNGNVTIGETTKYINVSKNSYIEYIYKIGGIKYIGTTQPSPFSEYKLIVPHGRYFVIYNSKNPAINALIQDKKTIDEFTNIDFDTVKIDKSLLKLSLRNGGCIAKEIER